MDRYMKGFVVMSMVYLFAGSVLGIWLYAHGPTMDVRFAHVHLNLLGFMAMMIFGVGYFILPRFAGRTLRWPGLVAVHFWASNLSLWGMVLSHSAWGGGFLFFSALQAASAGVFLGNVGMSILGTAKEHREPAQAYPPRQIISSDSKVAELVEAFPGVRELLIKEGIRALADPEHVERARKLGVTLGMMAKRHSLDEGELLEKVASFVGGVVAQGPGAAGTGISPAVTRDSVIGDVIKKHPETEEVFRRFYGEGCFSCPGQAFETIAQSALMHKVREEEILAELNRVIQSRGLGGSSDS